VFRSSAEMNEASFPVAITVHLCTVPCDMHLSFDGVSVIAEHLTECNPFRAADESGTKLIAQRGIDFVASADFLQRLQAAGANEVVAAGFAYWEAARTRNRSPHNGGEYGIFWPSEIPKRESWINCSAATFAALSAVGKMAALQKSVTTLCNSQ